MKDKKTLNSYLCDILDMPFGGFTKDNKFYVNYNNDKYITPSGALELKRIVLNIKRFNDLGNALEIMCEVKSQLATNKTEVQKNYTSQFFKEIDEVIIDLIEFDKEIYEKYVAKDESLLSLDEMGRFLRENRNLVFWGAVAREKYNFSQWIQAESDLEDDESYIFMKSDMIHFFKTLNIDFDEMGFFSADNCNHQIRYMKYYWNQKYDSFDFENKTFHNEMKFIEQLENKVIREVEMNGVKENLLKTFLQQDFIVNEKYNYLDLLTDNVIYKNGKIICTTNVLSREMPKLFEVENCKGMNIFFEERDLEIDEKEQEEVINGSVFAKIINKYNIDVKYSASLQKKRIYILNVESVPDILVEKMMMALNMDNGKVYTRDGFSFSKETMTALLRDLDLSIEMQNLKNVKEVSVKKKI